MPAAGQKLLVSPDGTKLWAEAAGDSSKPAVVFIHGFACTALAFDHQLADENLLANLHLVRYELRGHGRSGHPEQADAYTSIRYAEDFRTVCEGFGITKPFLLGWSLGGRCVLDVIDAYGAEYLSGAIYLGGSVFSLALHRTYAHPDLLELLPALMSEDANLIPDTVVKFIHSCVAKPDVDLSFGTKLQWMGGYAMQSPRVRQLALRGTQNEERWAAEIKGLPVMVVQGTEDTHSRAAALVETAKQNLGTFDLKLMDGVGHSPHVERPRETNQYILEFVQKVAS